MENRYSRQIGAIGKDVMSKLVNLKVVILGCDTVGMECAKSLALMGIKHFYLYDNTKVSQKYNGRIINYINKKSNRKTLGQLCKDFINELTCSSAKVVLLDKKGLVNNLIRTKKDLYDCIVDTRVETNTFEYESVAMKHKKPYIYGHNVGFLGYVFSNFGKWNVLDSDGENTISGFINRKEINKTDKCIKIFIEGIKKLPCNNSYTIKSRSGIELSGNILNKTINVNKILNIQELEITIEYSEILDEFLKKELNYQYFEKKDIVLYENKYFDKTKTIFNIPNDNYKYIDLTSSFNLNSKSNKVHDSIINYLAHKNKSKISGTNCDTKFYPLGVIIGSILAHEVIKCSHKYIPLQEELVFDYSGLKSSNLYLSKGNYWDMNALLDRDLVRKIKKLKMFMIGCGALGCEISKNLVMMGFGECYSGRLDVTDMDTIELSNLSRQFLFRPEDINKNKSDVLKSRLVSYKEYYDNSIITLNNEVGKTNERIFSRNWWEEKDIVINALDNVAARQYVDSCCNKYDKPLFESGTLGTKCNTQVILPYETATYSEIKDPVDNSIPMCTVRNFPHKKEHSVEWGLDLFSKIFTDAINDYNSFIKDPTKCIDLIKSVNNDTLIAERFRNLINILEFKGNQNVESLIDLVNKIFSYSYILPIKEILKTFPCDMKNSTGELFWSGKKLMPCELEHKCIDKDFITAVGKILGYNIDTIDVSIKDKRDIIAKNKVNQLNTKELNIDEANDKVEVIVSDEEIAMLNEKIDCLGKSIQDKSYDYVSDAKYEKDDDLHKKLMTYIVNFRSKCYKIEECDNLTIKLISGRIVPALSTTTSLIGGFVMIDILKYLSSNSKKWIIKPTECNINLATNQYNIYDSLKPKITHNKMYSEEFGMNVLTIPSDYNTWSKFRIRGAKDYVNTVKELVKYLNQQYKIPEPDMLSVGNQILYSKGCKSDKDLKEIYTKLDKNITEIITIDICASSDSFQPILTPPILYSYLN